MRVMIAAGVTPTVGGVSAHINSLCRALRAMGHEAVVVTPLGVSEEFRAFRSDVSRALAAFLRLPAGMLSAYFASQYMLRTNMRRALASGEFDIVHAQDVSAANAALSLPLAVAVPVLLTVHGCLAAEAVADGRIKSGSWGKAVLLAQERLACSRAPVVSTVARRLVDHIREMGQRSDAIPLIPNFVDADRFEYAEDVRRSQRERLQIADEEFAILCPRRLLPQYGIEFLVKAVPALVNSDSRKRPRVLLAGAGRQAQPLADLAVSLGISAYVTMLGEIPNSLMPSIYAASDAVVIPSISVGKAVEGTSVAALEAMACGRPVVASAIGGLLDIIADEVTGLLVPERDPAALAAALLGLMEDPSLGPRLGQSAASRVRAHYSSGAAAESYVQIYSRVAGNEQAYSTTTSER